MKSAEMRTLVDRYIDAYNRMDIPAMLLTVHPDVEFKNISGDGINASANDIPNIAIRRMGISTPRIKNESGANTIIED